MKIKEKIVEEKAKVEAWVKNHERDILGVVCGAMVGAGGMLATVIMIGKRDNGPITATSAGSLARRLWGYIPEGVDYDVWRVDPDEAGEFGYNVKDAIFYAISTRDKENWSKIEK